MESMGELSIYISWEELGRVSSPRLQMPIAFNQCNVLNILQGINLICSTLSLAPAPATLFLHYPYPIILLINLLLCAKLVPN